MRFLSKATQATTTTAAIHDKRTANPEYGRLYDEKTALSLAHGALTDERTGIYERIRDNGEMRADPVSERQVRAAALVGDAPPSGGQDDRRRLIEIADEMGALDDANRILSGRIADESAKASRVIVEQIGPQYRAAVLAICDRIVELHRANQAFHALTDSLNDADVAWAGALIPMHPTFLGSPKDKQSAPALFLQDAVKRGFYPAANVPRELTH